MTIEQRVERLERTNRRYRWGIVITITLVAIAEIVATVILIGYYVPDVIRAKRFEVVNEVGTKAVALFALEGNGRVHTYSAKGTRLVELGSPLFGGDGWVTTSSAEGKTLARLGDSHNHSEKYAEDDHNHRREYAEDSHDHSQLHSHY